MKRLRIAMLVAVTGITVAACGSAGEATIAAPTSAIPPQISPAESVVLTTTPETPLTATVIVTAAPAVSAVTVTAPPPVVTTVTQMQQPPVIVVPDPTTVYADYYGPYNLPDGLYCRDLKAQGYSYSDAIIYWNYHGQPDRMDLDLNGIPCETVY